MLFCTYPSTALESLPRSIFLSIGVHIRVQLITVRVGYSSTSAAMLIGQKCDFPAGESVRSHTRVHCSVGALPTLVISGSPFSRILVSMSCAVTSYHSCVVASGRH